MRMIRSKPSTPPATTRAATTSRATTWVAVPPPQPSWVKTVAVASVASEVRTVSQPTVSTQDRTAGTRPPVTPNAARLSTRVGDQPAEPEARDDADHPGDRGLPEGDAEAEGEGPVGQAQHADVRAEPRPEQLPGAALALGLG